MIMIKDFYEIEKAGFFYCLFLPNYVFLNLKRGWCCDEV